jgi:hyperosmotically inducible protein
MKAFSGFLLGVIVGGAVVWLLMSPRAREDMKDGIKSEAAAVREKVAEKAPEVKAAVERAGEKAADATADARTTAAIKLKLAADSQLSALQISVDTTAGLVTLAGKVKSPELVDKAVNLAKSVEGVRDVKST